MEASRAQGHALEEYVADFVGLGSGTAGIWEANTQTSPGIEVIIMSTPTSLSSFSVV